MILLRQETVAIAPEIFSHGPCPTAGRIRRAGRTTDCQGAWEFRVHYPEAPAANAAASSLRYVFDFACDASPRSDHSHGWKCESTSACNTWLSGDGWSSSVSFAPKGYVSVWPLIVAKNSRSRPGK